MMLMTYDIRHILAVNLQHLLDTDEDLNTMEALSDRTGGVVKPRTITNYLNPDTAPASPNLKMVDAIAKAYKLESWQLLHPTLGKTEISRDDLDLARRVISAIKSS